MKSLLPFLLVLTILTAVQARTDSTSTAAALDQLNVAFRNQYALNRAENLASLPLIIIVDTPKITWVSHGKTQQINIPMVHYTESKILLHSILGTYGLGSRIVRSGGTPAEWQDARTLRANIDTALRLTTHTTLNAADQTRLHSVLLRLRDAVSRWIAAGSLSQKQLEQDLRAVRADAMTIVNEMALQHYQNLRNAFATIHHGVSASDWKNALVVAVGSPAARRNKVEVAAAIPDFGRNALGRSIFYSENIYDTPTAIQFLAGLEADKGLSETFFDTPYRMWLDLLGDGVKGQVGGGFYPGLAR